MNSAAAAAADELRAAGTPSTTSDDIAVLARHTDVRIRCLCAVHPQATVDVVASLAVDDHPSVRRAVASRRDLSAQDRQRLARDSDRTVQRRIFRSGALSIDELLALLGGPSGHLAYQRIRAELDDPAVTRRLLAEPRWAALAASGRIDDSTLRDCFDAMVPWVRLQVAQRATLTSRSVRWLARNAERSVSESIGMRADLDVTTRRWIVRHGHPWAAAAVLRSSQDERSILRRARRRRSVIVVRERARLERSALRRLVLARSEHWDVRVAVVTNARTSPRLLRRFNERGTWAIRDAIANRPDVASVVTSSVGWHPGARLTLATNPATPANVIAELLADVNPYVRAQARGHAAAPVGAVLEAAADPRRPAWELRRIAEHPGLVDAERDRILTWLALGGAEGDVHFDPVSCTGTPGEVGQPHEDAYRYECDVDALLSPLWRARRHVGIAPQHGTLPRATVAAMARDPHPEVRVVAAGFSPNADLEDLANDAAPAVSARATTTLARPVRRWDPIAVWRDWRPVVGWLALCAASLTILGLIWLSGDDPQGRQLTASGAPKASITMSWTALADAPGDDPVCSSATATVWYRDDGVRSDVTVKAQRDVVVTATMAARDGDLLTESTIVAAGEISRLHAIDVGQLQISYSLPAAGTFALHRAATDGTLSYTGTC